MSESDPYVVLSLSGGKDSTAMLLGMLERHEHIDEVINCDTGMEFPAMYDHLERLFKIIHEEGIKLTILRSEESFEYLMLEKEIKSEKYGDHYGYGWPSINARWCTKHMKLLLIDNYLKSLKEEHPNMIQCIGLASDETERLKRDNNKKKNHRHPLVEWGWDEKKCLQYCYDMGFNWDGLYEIFHRVSCWCCPLTSIPELKKLWWYFPLLWHQLEEWEVRMSQENVGKKGRFWFKNETTVFDLSARFSIEKRRELNGLSNRKLSKEVKNTLIELPKSQKTLDVVIG